MAFWDYTLIGALIALALAGITYLLIVPPLRLLPWRWRLRLRWPLVALAGLFGVWSSLNLITQTSLFNDYFETYPAPGMHACGGPYVPNAAPCEREKWESWRRDNAAARHRYRVWVSTPPPLRQPCEWVAPSLCRLIGQNPLVGTWSQYLGLIVAYLESGLACAAVTDWLLWRAGKRKKRKLKNLPLDF